ncbi:hypothetical protein RB653_004086 [Dictyostelium firmibasis]|uniref:HMG box domain-containing protein n=1 Tax=Dictyostelium firmibasis TaxID=79012 RepID=A0AAN7YXP6_9MYCE
MNTNNNNNNLFSNNINPPIIPQVESFQLPTSLTNAFEEDTDSDMALDSDDDLENLDNYDLSDDNDYDDNENETTDENFDIDNNNGSNNNSNNNNNSKSKSKSKSAEPKEKKPPNAFILFTMDKRKELRINNPELTNAMVSSLLGKEWKELHPSEKKKYVEKAATFKK